MLDHAIANAERLATVATPDTAEWARRQERLVDLKRRRRSSEVEVVALQALVSQASSDRLVEVLSEAADLAPVDRANLDQRLEAYLFEVLLWRRSLEDPSPEIGDESPGADQGV